MTDELKPLVDEKALQAVFSPQWGYGYEGALLLIKAYEAAKQPASPVSEDAIEIESNGIRYLCRPNRSANAMGAATPNGVLSREEDRQKPCPAPASQQPDDMSDTVGAILNELARVCSNAAPGSSIACLLPSHRLDIANALAPLLKQEPVNAMLLEALKETLPWLELCEKSFKGKAPAALPKARQAIAAAEERMKP